MKYKVVTDHPVALDSPDHILKHGTMNDNYKSPGFCDLMINYFNRPFATLDLGCAGGGMVADFIERGYPAIGLEGSDYSLLCKRAEWATIPDSLFTCDLAKPFEILQRKDDNISWEAASFDLITAWEFFEHLREEDVGGLFEHIAKHLKPHGLLIASIAFEPDVGGPWHQNCKPREWWLDFAEKFGFRHNDWMKAQIYNVAVRKYGWDTVFVWNLQ